MPPSSTDPQASIDVTPLNGAGRLREHEIEMIKPSRRGIIGRRSGIGLAALCHPGIVRWPLSSAPRASAFGTCAVARALSPVRRGFAPGVQAKIVSLAFGAVVVTLVCSVISIVQTRATHQAQVFTDQATLGKTYALVVQEYLTGSRVVLEALARTPAMRAALRPEAIRPELNGIPPATDVERRAAMVATMNGSGRLQTMIVVAPGFDL
jgi:hypothetical protein